MDTPTWSRKRIAALGFLSTEIGKTTASGLLVINRSIIGISTRHGTHHEAQKCKAIIRPRKSDKWNVRPLKEDNSMLGATLKSRGIGFAANENVGNKTNPKKRNSLKLFAMLNP